MSLSSCRSSAQRDALRPPERRRILHRPVEHQRHEQQHDEVQQQRRHHFVHAKARSQQRRDQQQQRAGQHRGAEHRRKQYSRRQIEPGSTVQTADGDGGKRTGIKLALGTDVPQPRAKCDGRRKTGQHQRRRARQRLAPCETRAESAVEHQRIGFADRRARPRDQQHGHAERERDRCERRDDQCRPRQRRARFKPHERGDHPTASAADGVPAIASPIAARVHVAAGRASVRRPA